MTRQGCCGGPAWSDAQILDRLAGLSKVIPPAIIEQVLLDTGRDRQRACRLSHRVTLWVVLAMGVLTHLPIRQVFKHARRIRPGENTPSRSNLCEARQRLGVEPVRRAGGRGHTPLGHAADARRLLPRIAFGGHRWHRAGCARHACQRGPLSSAAAAVAATAPSRRSARSASSNWARMWNSRSHIGGWQDSEQNLVDNCGTKFPPTPAARETAVFSATTIGKRWIRRVSSCLSA